jgi:hypothetical protein
MPSTSRVALSFDPTRTGAGKRSLLQHVVDVQLEARVLHQLLAEAVDRASVRLPWATAAPLLAA